MRSDPCLNVALVTDEYPPARLSGGIGTYTRTLARLLASNGHHVHVFCQDDGRPKETSGEFIHMVSPLEVPWRPLRFMYYRCVAPLFEPLQRRALWGIAVARRIVEAECALGRKFDVIEIPEAGGYVGFLWAGGVRTPKLIRLHGGTAMLCRHSGQRPDKNTRQVIQLERWSLQFGDVVTAPSRAIVRETSLDLGIRSSVPCLIYPYPAPRFSTGRYAKTNRRDPNLMIMVGRLCRLKGTDLVFQVFDRIRGSFRNLRLVMIGRNAWEDLRRPVAMERLIADGVCTLAGELEAAEVKRWLDHAGMLVVASQFENYPNVILEALQCGCLVIASNTGGVPEIITDRRTGLLFQRGSAEDLENKIRWALDHPIECEAMREAGRAWIKNNLSNERVLNSIIQAYRLTREVAQAQERRRIVAKGSPLT